MAAEKKGPEMQGAVSEPLSRQAHLKIIFLASGFFFVFGVTNVSYLLPVYYGKYGVSPADAGILVSIFYTVSLISRPFLGSLTEAIGFRRLFLLAGALSVTSSSCIALFAGNFWPAFISRAILGLGNGMFQIGFAAYQAIAFDKKERGRAFSLIMAGGLLPMMTWLPLGEWLLLHGFPRLYIMIPLSLSIAASVVAPFIPDISDVILKKKTGQNRQNPFSGLYECLKIPAFRMAAISMFLFSLTDATSSFMSIMTASFGLMASLFLSSDAVVGVFVRLTCGRLLDKFPRWKLSAPTILLTSGAVFLASVQPTEKSLMLLGLIFGFGMGIGFPLQLALVSDSVSKQLQPQAVSISWFLMGLDFAAVPLLMGWLSGIIGPVWTVRALTATAIIGSLMLMAGCRKTNRRE